MKKLYFLLFFAFSFFANAQIINFTDANFKAKLLSASSSNQIASISTPNSNGYVVSYNTIDTNYNGEIEVSEALSIQYLNISNSNIANLSGIEFFTNLIKLDVGYNQLTNINLFYNNSLRILICRDNNLNSLNIFTLNNLRNLNCENNQLTNIDLSPNSNLQYLYLNRNLLTTLNIAPNVYLIRLEVNDNLLNSINIGSNNLLLETIHIWNNQLTTINVTQLPALKELDAWKNQINSIDVTQNNNLRYLYIGTNPISNIDLSQNPLLNSLYVSQAQFSSLDVSQNTLLEVLNLGNNQFSNIDLSNNLLLKDLDVSSNYFTNLDITQFNNLLKLNCNNNFLTNLDVSQNLNLQELRCYSNQLLTLNVTNNFNLFRLNCSNNSLESLYLKNGNQSDFVFLDFFNNPDLQYVCANEEDVDLVQQKIDIYNYSLSCQVNSYCSFTPGGTFYEITGSTKFDFNSNGCDVSDINYSKLKFVITDGTNSGTMIANTTGDYYIPVQAGNHTVTPVLENPTYFNISPSSFTVDFPTQASPFTQDFCVTANGVYSDVEIMLMSTTPARPGFDADYKIVYRNKGNQIENGSVSLAFDDTVLDYLSSNPVYNSNATNSFTWNYTNLQPFETREIEITFNVNSPMESPAVNIDDVLNYTTTITTANTDETPDDNTFTLNQTVVGSYDPNDKTCLEGETVDVATVGKYVHYVIRFENTGTYPAQNIVVKDMIDISKFDVSTLVPLNGSHEFYTRIKDNKVEFIFENINLDFNDATNDGYVSFKIKTLPTLTVGETFSNDANIYFDYNFPITTNEYVTTIQNVLSNQDFAFENEFVLYPNPAKEVLNISSKNQTEISSIEIYNIVGQVVIAIPNATKTIDVSNLETGTYFIKVNTEKGSTTTKFVRE